MLRGNGGIQSRIVRFVETSNSCYDKNTCRGHVAQSVERPSKGPASSVQLCWRGFDSGSRHRSSDNCRWKNLATTSVNCKIKSKVWEGKIWQEYILLALKTTGDTVSKESWSAQAKTDKFVMLLNLPIMALKGIPDGWFWSWLNNLEFAIKWMRNLYLASVNELAYHSGDWHGFFHFP